MQQGLLITEVSLRVHVVQRSSFTVCTYVRTLYVCALCAYWQVYVCLYYNIMLFVGSYNIMSEVCEWETSVYMRVCVYLSVFVLSFQQ